MIAHAEAQGLPASAVGSIYQEGPEAIKVHEARNGYDKPWGPKVSCVWIVVPLGSAVASSAPPFADMQGVQLIEGDSLGKIKSLDGIKDGVQTFTYQGTGNKTMGTGRTEFQTMTGTTGNELGKVM